MSENLRKQVVIVDQRAFLWGWMGETRRIFHLTSAFRQLGYDVVLLAGRKTNEPIQSRIDEQYDGTVIRTKHSGAYPWIMDHNFHTRRACRVTWRMRGPSCYWRKQSLGFADKYDGDWWRALLQKHGIQPALIWGICVGSLDSGLVAKKLSDQWGVPWIFELQDPPNRAGLGEDHQVIVDHYRQLLQDASRIVVVAGRYGEEVAQRFGCQEKIHTIHLTHEGGRMDSGGKRSDAFTIVYAGTLEAKRSILPLLRALKNVIEQKPDLRSMFKICLVGEGIGFDQAASFADEHQLRDLLDFVGQQKPDAVGQFIKAGHAIYIMQPDHNFKQVPGKVFESLRSGKPIIGVMPKDCEAADILRQSGLGIIHEKNDVDGIAKTLMGLYESWIRGERPVTPDQSVIDHYSLSRLPMKIEQAIKDLVDVPRPGR